jgi:hypothetical protein
MFRRLRPFHVKRRPWTRLRPGLSLLVPPSMSVPEQVRAQHRHRPDVSPRAARQVSEVVDRRPEPAHRTQVAVAQAARQRAAAGVGQAERAPATGRPRARRSSPAPACRAWLRQGRRRKWTTAPRAAGQRSRAAAPRSVEPVPRETPSPRARTFGRRAAGLRDVDCLSPGDRAHGGVGHRHPSPSRAAGRTCSRSAPRSRVGRRRVGATRRGPRRPGAWHGPASHTRVDPRAGGVPASSYLVLAPGPPGSAGSRRHPCGVPRETRVHESRPTSTASRAD